MSNLMNLPIDSELCEYEDMEFVLRTYHNVIAIKFLNTYYQNYNSACVSSICLHVMLIQISSP